MKLTLPFHATILLAVLCSSAQADSPGFPQPYTLPLDDSLFVMLPGHCDRHLEMHRGLNESEFHALHDPIEASMDEAKAALPHTSKLDPCAYFNAHLRIEAAVSYGGEKWDLGINNFSWKYETSLQNAAGEIYPASGLYPGDGSVTPIWTVAWYDMVYLSGNGRYMVRMGPWAREYDDLAIAFYDRGKLLQAYTINELVRKPSELPHSISHFGWRRQISHDAGTDRISLVTKGDEVHEFDITTGQLLHSHFIEHDSFTVAAETLSGENHTLYGFEATAGTYLAMLESDIGKSASQYICGTRTIEPDKGDGISKIQEIVLPFSDITRISRTDDSNDAEVYWRVSLRSGDEQVIKVQQPGNPPVRFSGKTSRGESLDLEVKDIRQLEFQ